MEWNDERITELTRMWREGLSASQVARQLGGVSRSAVIGKVHRLGIAGRSLPSRPRNSGGRPANAVRASPGRALRKPVLHRAPRPAPPPTMAFEVPATATILTLVEDSCRWPIGNPDEAGFGFCGRPRLGGGSYCQGHGSMALRRRDVGMKRREIDHIVSRYVEGPRTWASQEASQEASQAASLAVAR
jgi:GcrA cell cycle regulator